MVNVNWQGILESLREELDWGEQLKKAIDGGDFLPKDAEKYIKWIKASEKRRVYDPVRYSGSFENTLAEAEAAIAKFYKRHEEGDIDIFMVKVKELISMVEEKVQGLAA
jgi:hypothetical protein